MEKLTIENRNGQRIAILLEECRNPRGLAIIMHGLSGNKEEPHIVTFAEAFSEKGYTVLRFDTTNTFGESDGQYESATVTNYFEDLEDVIRWAKTQMWYIEPFYLVGHSLGGICTVLYAEKYPQKIKGLAPISTVVSGTLSMETAKYKKQKIDWEKTGWFTEKSSISPTGIKTLPWSHMVDRLMYDILPNANRLVMPVLLIVGDKDESTPYAHQLLFYNRLPAEKEIHCIKGAPHSFKEQKHLKQIKQIFVHWIDTHQE